MNVLIFGYDRSVLDPGSFTIKRQAALADLADANLEIILLSKQHKDIHQYITDRIRVHAFKGFVFIRLIKTLRMGLRVRADIISAQDPCVTGLIAYTVSRKNKIPLEIQVHGDYLSGPWARISFMHRLYVLFIAFVLKKADVIRVVSERIKYQITRLGITEDHITIIPIAQDVMKLIKREPNTWLESPTIITPCRFVQEKRLDVLIKAYGLLKEQGIDFKALVIGEGPYKNNVRSWIMRAELESYVSIVDWMDQKDMEEWIKTLGALTESGAYEELRRTTKPVDMGHGSTLLELVTNV